MNDRRAPLPPFDELVSLPESPVVSSNPSCLFWFDPGPSPCSLSNWSNDDRLEAPPFPLFPPNPLGLLFWVDPLVFHPPLPVPPFSDNGMEVVEEVSPSSISFLRRFSSACGGGGG